MNQFDRTELKLLLKGLQRLRDEMLDELDGDPGDEEFNALYNKLLKLQDLIGDAVDSRFY